MVSFVVVCYEAEMSIAKQKAYLYALYHEIISLQMTTPLRSIHTHSSQAEDADTRKKEKQDSNEIATAPYMLKQLTTHPTLPPPLPTGESPLLMAVA
jgi:hypothetical protein